MRRLSLAHLTAINLPPPDLIGVAAQAGFDAVGLRLIRVTDTSPGYPLMDDPALMRATRAALNDTGLRVHDIEFVRITPEIDIPALDPFLDTGAALGAAEVIAAPYDPDLSRLADRLALLAERAAARGLGVSLEFFPWTDVPDLATALKVAQRAGPSVGVLPDALHFDRSGGDPAMLARVPPGRVRFAHLCDAPVHPPYATDDLLHTARAERLPPGEGQIDLAALLAALPPGLPLGLEVPMTALQHARGAEAVVRRVMAATRRLLGAGQV
jgi:sugar phosphate isomerase/epimerase